MMIWAKASDFDEEKYTIMKFVDLLYSYYNSLHIGHWLQATRP